MNIPLLIYADAVARRCRAKRPKAMGIGMQIQHPFAHANFAAEMLLATVSDVFGIECIKAEILSTNGVKKTDKPDNNPTKIVLFSM